MTQDGYRTSSLNKEGLLSLEDLCGDLDNYIKELSFSNPTSPTVDSTRDINPTIYEIQNPYYSTPDTETEYDQVFSLLQNQTITLKKVDSLPNRPIETPPVSPSVLRIRSVTQHDYFSGRDDNNNSSIINTRSSSLNRRGSGKSSVQFSNPPSLPTLPLQFSNPSPIPTSPLQFSNPTSPLALELISDQKEFPNHAFISFMTHHIIKSVISLNEHRRIYCSTEYPLSFTGEEIMDIIRSFSPDDLQDSIYLEIAQLFIRSTPRLIKPIDSSEKSIRKNKIYDSPTEVYTLVEEELDEDIQGIYTPFTRCYSISCLPGQTGCYSPSCPNKLQSLNGSLFKTPAKSFISSSSHDTTLSRAWSATVARDILKSMPENEIKRQEAIHELIYTEDDYVRDLKILDIDFAKELLGSQCMEESRKQAFHDKVLNNYQDLLEIHSALYQDLRDHQANCQSNNGIGLIDQVGDILLRHIPRFMAAYIRYGPHVVLAEYEAKREAERNVVFKHFIKAREALPQCRRLPFRHFILLPVTRLQRYSLLLDAILKKTAEDNPDRDQLRSAIDQIKTVAERVDEATSITKNTVRVMEISERIRFKQDETLDLTGHRLIKEGVLTRKSHMNLIETVEIHLFLFDHLVLMTKKKKNGSMEEYAVSKRPIPLGLLVVGEDLKASAGPGETITMSFSSTTFPIVLSHLGRHGGDYPLFAESAAVRSDWKEKILAAQVAWRESRKSVFDLQTLSDTKFSIQASPHYHGKVTCSAPFSGPKGLRMVVIGTQQGVWLGIEGDNQSVQQLMTIPDVQQIAVLDKHDILLVLSDKTLYAYALGPLLRPMMLKKGMAEKPSYKITTNVSYFNAGVCNGRTIVVAMKKKGVDSNFKVFEPVCGDLSDEKNATKYFVKAGLFGKSPAWFKNYIEFYVGTESYGIHFLKARLVVICARGFEIVDLESLNSNRNLPDMKQPDFGFVQARGEELRPLGMFRCQNNFLLCYDAFAFSVNVHGGFMKESPLIEWEGVPQSVAFYYPYIIGFDTRFIEVRHVETGELVQIITGTNLRCLQYIHANNVPHIHGCMTHPFKPDFQYIFQLTGTF